MFPNLIFSKTILHHNPLILHFRLILSRSHLTELHSPLFARESHSRYFPRTLQCHRFQSRYNKHRFPSMWDVECKIRDCLLWKYHWRLNNKCTPIILRFLFFFLFKAICTTYQRIISQMIEYHHALHEYLTIVESAVLSIISAYQLRAP